MSGLLALLLLACTMQCAYSAPNELNGKIEQELENLMEDLGKRELVDDSEALQRVAKDLDKTENMHKVDEKLNEATERAVKRLEAEQRGADSITLYEHTYYRGKSYAISSSKGFVGSWWNDKASSMKISGCSKWRVYQHAYYQGRSMCISANVGNLVSFYFNDVISSVKKGC